MKKKIGELEIKEETGKVIVQHVSFFKENENAYLELFHYFKNNYVQLISGKFNNVQYSFLENYVTKNDRFLKEPSKFVPTHILKGLQLEKLNQKFIQKVTFTSEALRDWIREPFDFDDKNGTLEIPPFYEILSHEVIKEKFRITLKLCHDVSYKSKKNEPIQECRITVEFQEKKTVSEIADFVRKFQKLILFITNKNPIVDSIFINERIELYMLQSNLASEQFSYNVVPNYQFIKHKLGNLIEFWFSNKALEPVIDLIQEMHFNSGLEFHRYLLSTVTAFESLDKFVLKTIYKNSQDIDVSKLKKEIFKALSSCDKLLKSFKNNNTIKNWGTSKNDKLINRFELQKTRIETIIKEVFSYDSTEFIKKTKNTRDNLAHQGIYSNHFNSTEIILASKTMEFLVKLLIYQKVDISIQDENDSLESRANEEIKYLARINNFKEI